MNKQNLKIENVRHSLAHLLAMSVLEIQPDAKLGIGPVIENGFYYDFLLGKKLESPDLLKLEKRMKELIKRNLSFKKETVIYEEAKKIFSAKNGQHFKLELIEELQKSKKPLTIYETCDSISYKLKTKSCFIDLCAGPHVKNTSEIDPEAFKIEKIAGAYWKGDEKNPMLTRIYAVAFQDKKELNNYLKLQEELEKRDHRKLGRELDLFSFHDVAPGAPFWHPKGMIIVKELEKLWRKKHEEAGYLETSTPILVKDALFKQSGHLEHYKEKMYPVKIENETYYLKPMNCPESAIIYSSKIRSYKDLPLRLSEIGRLHRHELSGVLSGLFRVRQITMDDAHIYARPDQIQNEIGGVLKLIKEFYKLFNLKPDFYLSTKPDNAMGDPKLWQKAEKALGFALKKNKIKYGIKPKDGAFYGPKIDVQITDALGRLWQIATIQLDFQMPKRFDLDYTDEKSKKQRPVMIHRAIFGSFERFIGILIEHYAGALPFWLSPVQVSVIPIASRHEKYAKNVLNELKNNNIRAELKAQNETVGKKIREAELQKIPYILIIGDEEINKKSVRVRERRKGDAGLIKLERFLKKLLCKKVIHNYRNSSLLLAQPLPASLNWRLK